MRLREREVADAEAAGGVRGMRLKDFVALPTSRAAHLKTAHVAALRICACDGRPLKPEPQCRGCLLGVMPTPARSTRLLLRRHDIMLSDD